MDEEGIKLLQQKALEEQRNEELESVKKEVTTPHILQVSGNHLHKFLCMMNLFTMVRNLNVVKNIVLVDLHQAPVLLLLAPIQQLNRLKRSHKEYWDLHQKGMCNCTLARSLAHSLTHSLTHSLF